MSFRNATKEPTTYDVLHKVKRPTRYKTGTKQIKNNSGTKEVYMPPFSCLSTTTAASEN